MQSHTRLFKLHEWNGYLVSRVHRHRALLGRGYHPQSPPPNDTSGNNYNKTIPVVPDELCLGYQTQADRRTVIQKYNYY